MTNHRKPEDIYDVMQLMLLTNQSGKQNKEIACEVKPDLAVGTAKAWLSNATNRDSPVHMKPHEFERFLDACGNVEVFIHYLCDKHGFERPARRVVLTPEKEVKILRQALKDAGLDVDPEKVLEKYRDIVSLEVEKAEAPRWWVRFLGRSGRG